MHVIIHKLSKNKINAPHFIFLYPFENSTCIFYLTNQQRSADYKTELLNPEIYSPFLHACYQRPLKVMLEGADPAGRLPSGLSKSSPCLGPHRCSTHIQMLVFENMKSSLLWAMLFVCSRVCWRGGLMAVIVLSPALLQKG